MRNTFTAPLELKFVGDEAKGEFDGYGAVFGNVDSHGDLVQPGAFSQSLAQTKAAGRKVSMHLNHGLPMLGGRRGVGVWNDVAEDGKGLRVSGRISGMNTDGGRLLYEQVKDGAFSGLSIGYRVPPNGAVTGTKAAEPKRTLKTLDLLEISLVDAPSNPQALVGSVKAAFADADPDQAASSVAAAIRMHDKVMKGYSYSGNAKDQALMMDHLRDAHEHLTGSRAPDGMEGWTKSAEADALVKALCERFAISRDEALALVEGKAGTSAHTFDPTDVQSLSSLVTGFILPSFS